MNDVLIWLLGVAAGIWIGGILYSIFGSRVKQLESELQETKEHWRSTQEWLDETLHELCELRGDKPFKMESEGADDGN